MPVKRRTGGAIAGHPAPRPDDGLPQHAAGDRGAAETHPRAEDARLGVAGHARGRSVPDIARIADEALAARVNIYVLHLDPMDHADASTPRVFPTCTEDREMMSEGLEFMAGVGRGALFRTSGTAEFAFTQIANELAGSYLLTIEPQASDRDGRMHAIDLKVRRAGALVRSRHRFAVTPTPPDQRPRRTKSWRCCARRSSRRNCP